MRHGRIRSVSANPRTPLEHGWQVARTSAGAIADASGIGGLAWQPARVPEPIRDPGSDDWWWRCPLPAALLAEGAMPLLVVDGIATRWDLWADGEWIGHGERASGAHELDLPRTARELVLCCRAPHSGIAGPWRAIAIERRTLWLGALALEVRCDGEDGVVEVALGVPGELERTELVVTRGDERVTAGLAAELGVATGTARIARCARWFPRGHGESARYAIAIELLRGGERVLIDLGLSGFRTRDGAAAAGHTRLATFDDDARYDALDANGDEVVQQIAIDARDPAQRAELVYQLQRLVGRPAIAALDGPDDPVIAAIVSGILPGVPYVR